MSTDESLLAHSRNLRAGLQQAVDYDDEVAAIYNVLRLVQKQAVEQACAVPAPAVVTPEPAGGGEAAEYASESVWAELRGLYEIAKRAWAVRTSTDPGAPGELDQALDFYASVALPAHLARIVKPVPYPQAAEAGKAQAAPAVEAWAVECLDAHAERLESSAITPSRVGVTSKVDGARLGYWRISVNGIRALQGDCQGMFPTANAARIAAARSLYAADPSLPPPPKASR